MKHETPIVLNYVIKGQAFERYISVESMAEANRIAHRVIAWTDTTSNVKYTFRHYGQKKTFASGRRLI